MSPSTIACSLLISVELLAPALSLSLSYSASLPRIPEEQVQPVTIKETAAS